MPELKDWLNSINQTKTNLMLEDASVEKSYPPYVINKCLAYCMDSLMYANEMNMHWQLDKRLQYDFFINTLRPRRRFSPWEKKEGMKELELVKQYYGYSTEKAKQALRILSPEQLEMIRSKMNTGGTK